MNIHSDLAPTSVKTHLSHSIPKWFWVVSGIALLWFLMDSMIFFMRITMTDEAISAMPEVQQQLHRDFPGWVNLVFACEVFGGILGAIALLLKKKWALPLFIVSMLGVLAQTSYLWLLSDVIEVMGKMAIVMPMVAIVIGACLIFFARSAISKSWLR